LIQGKELRLYKDWVPFDEISPHLFLAVVVTEDQNFLEHFGFNIDAMQKAFNSNKKGKKIRGGSTISQQTAKNLFLWHGRNYFRKGLEAYFTLLIETFWSKERIIEVYLNIIEFGDGIYGVQEASRYYFQKNAKDISRKQAAQLAVILPNPRKYKVHKESAYMQRQVNWTIDQMRRWGYKLDFETRLTPGVDY
jgi:monofunctional biosynthetic peptidoglycan transglycosylase